MHGEDITMSVDNEVPESRGVTVEPLASMDLGPEIEGMAGRELRMRLVTMELGAVLDRSTTTVTAPASSTSCRARSPTTATV